MYLDLEELTEDQIEVGLEAGVWGDPARPIVQRHLDNMKLERIEAAAAKQLEAARCAIDAAQTATDEARGSNFRATVAVIIATSQWWPQWQQLSWLSSRCEVGLGKSTATGARRSEHHCINHPVCSGAGNDTR